MRYLTIFCLFFSFITNASEEEIKAVKLDNTPICFPANYSPSTSFMDAYLAPIKEQLDSSEGQELIYIPALAIKDKVPEYTVSHINSGAAPKCSLCCQALIASTDQTT